MAVHFTGLVPAKLRHRKALKMYINEMIKAFDKIPGQITFSFCTDAEILEANILFLSHNYFTDILTFDLSESNSTLLQADILISVDTVASNALKFNIPYITELYRVIFHGILHLCGYTDKTKSDINRMREAEEHHLTTFLNN